MQLIHDIFTSQQNMLQMYFEYFYSFQTFFGTNVSNAANSSSCTIFVQLYKNVIATTERVKQLTQRQFQCPNSRDTILGEFDLLTPNASRPLREVGERPRCVRCVNLDHVTYKQPAARAVRESQPPVNAQTAMPKLPQKFCVREM